MDISLKNLFLKSILPSVFIFVVTFSASPNLKAEKIVERYEDGTRKLEYSTDTKNRRHGRYVEYYPNGKKKLERHYKNGILNGRHTEYQINGKRKLERNYKKGKISGFQTEFDLNGKITHRVYLAGIKSKYFIGGKSSKSVELYSRTIKTIEKNLSKIQPLRRQVKFNGKIFAKKPTWEENYTEGELTKEYQMTGLRELNAFRYLAGLSHNVVLDIRQSRLAQYGSVLLQKHGSLDHHPPQPADMSKDFYDKAHKGTASSNLHQGGENIRDAIHGFMDDSDASNIDDLGHRAWCLNPKMAKTGFGQTEQFYAQWAFDRTGSPEREEYILYPNRGYYPTRFFGVHHAWSIALNPTQHRTPTKSQVKIKIWSLDKYYRIKEELKLNYFGIRSASHGMGPAIIFRPVIKGEKLHGKRFLVSTKWGSSKNDQKELNYFVEFYDYASPEEKIAKAEEEKRVKKRNSEKENDFDDEDTGDIDFDDLEKEVEEEEEDEKKEKEDG